MVEITKKAHSIDGFTHPAPGGKVVPFLFIENIGEEDDFFRNYQYLRIMCITWATNGEYKTHYTNSFTY